MRVVLGSFPGVKSMEMDLLRCVGDSLPEEILQMGLKEILIWRHIADKPWEFLLNLLRTK